MLFLWIWAMRSSTVKSSTCAQSSSSQVRVLKSACLGSELFQIIWWTVVLWWKWEKRKKKNLFPRAEGGYRCIPAVLLILKEVANSKVPEDNNQNQESKEDPTAVILGVVANIFQKIIEVLAKRLRKDPEGGKQACCPLYSLLWRRYISLRLLFFVSPGSAVSVSRRGYERLPPSGTNLGQRTSQWSPLYHFCHHHCGEETCPPKGLRWLC